MVAVQGTELVPLKLRVPVLYHLPKKEQESIKVLVC
jgi:hypothetical protein